MGIARTFRNWRLNRTAAEELSRPSKRGLANRGIAGSEFLAIAVQMAR